MVFAIPRGSSRYRSGHCLPAGAWCFLEYELPAGGFMLGKTTYFAIHEPSSLGVTALPRSTWFVSLSSIYLFSLCVCMCTCASVCVCVVVSYIQKTPLTQTVFVVAILRRLLRVLTRFPCLFDNASPELCMQLATHIYHLQVGSQGFMSIAFEQACHSFIRTMVMLAESKIKRNTCVRSRM